MTMFAGQHLRIAAALALALLLHAMLLWRGGVDAAYGESGSAGPAEGAGDAAQTLIDVWLQPPPAVVAADAAAVSVPVVEKPAVARSVQSAGGGGRGGYLAQVRARIEQQRRTLEIAAQGTAQVGFTVMADGSVSALRLERSAGHAGLDAEALQLVQRAVPLPLPPRQQPLRLSVPVLFE